MKIYIVQNATEQNVAFDVLPDTALLRNNEAFYLPDFSNDIRARVGLVFQISKLGKRIDYQFVDRYLSTASVAVWFCAADVEARCLAAGQGLSLARGFDKAFAVSPIVFDCKEIMNKPITGVLGEMEVSFMLSEDVLQAVYRCFSEATSYFTCKIGDLFFVSLSAASNSLQIGQQCSFALSGVRTFQCDIR